MKNSATKDLTIVSLLLATGVIVKYLTDIFTRTFLFFLLLDPLILINVIIFLKYKKPKYLLMVMVVETVLSATLFMTTDFYLLRPINILISYLICILFKNKNPKWIIFLSTVMSVITDVVFSFLLFLFLPGLTGVDTTEIMGILDNINQTFNGGLLVVVYGLSFMFLTIWATIPGFINMFLGSKVLKTLEKVGGIKS